MFCIHFISGPGSSVGIATELRAGRSGIESQWVKDFHPFQTDPGAHPAEAEAYCSPLTTFQCRGHGTVELYLYPFSELHRACNGITLPLRYIFILLYLTDAFVPYFLYSFYLKRLCASKNNPARYVFV